LGDEGPVGFIRCLPARDFRIVVGAEELVDFGLLLLGPSSSAISPRRNPIDLSPLSEIGRKTGAR